MNNCAVCDGEAVETIEGQWIDYATHQGLRRLHVMVPVITCHNCDFSYTDYRAEEIREKAVLIAPPI
jgi:C4-type Zn-finger protein